MQDLTNEADEAVSLGNSKLRATRRRATSPNLLPSATNLTVGNRQRHRRSEAPANVQARAKGIQCGKKSKGCCSGKEAISGEDLSR